MAGKAYAAVGMLGDTEKKEDDGIRRQETAAKRIRRDESEMG